MLHSRFSSRARLSFGLGTLLTNDFRGLGIDLDSNPISLVCKAISANGKPTVKISDDFGKSLGQVSDLNRYKRVFA